MPSTTPENAMNDMDSMDAVTSVIGMPLKHSGIASLDSSLSLSPAKSTIARRNPIPAANE